MEIVKGRCASLNRLNLFASLLSVTLLALGVGAIDTEAKSPKRNPYSDIRRITKENDQGANGLSMSFKTVLLNGTLYVIGGEEREGIIATKDLKKWVQVSNMTDLDIISHAAVAFKNKIWVIGGAGLNGFQKHVWSSSDGKNWHKSKSTPFEPRADLGVVVFKDKLWVLGGSGKELNSFSDVWCSEDGENWELVTDKAAFGKRDRHVALAFDGKMLVIGGNLYSSADDFSPQVWSSENGKDWNLETKDIGCRPNDGGITGTVFDNRIWLSAWGENGVTLWHSYKGRFWEEFKPQTVINEEVEALTVFHKKLHLFIYQGIMRLE